MLKLLGALSRGQRAYVFLGIDLILIPVALLFTYAVQALPTSPLQTLQASLPVLPYLLLIAAALSKWLGLPNIQLKAFERFAIGLTALYAVGLAVALAGLSWIAALGLPAGTHVIFGLCYFLFVVAVRMVLLQVVTAIYRRAEPRRRVLIYGAGTTAPSWPRR